jgi:hypothetical protein
MSVTDMAEGTGRMSARALTRLALQETAYYAARVNPQGQRFALIRGFQNRQPFGPAFVK